MPIDFYYMPASATSRAIQMTAKAIGVELNLKLTDLMKGEQLKPEFIKINPQHTIPTISDNGFNLWESRAIMAYLVDQYADNDSLYPKEPQKRALVDQRLYFDMGTMYQRFAEYFMPTFMHNKPADPDKLKRCSEAIGFLDIFLNGQTYVAGETLTIADFMLIATVSSFELIGFDLSKYTNVQRWFDMCKETMPGYEINEAGLAIFKQFLDSKLDSKK